MPQSRRPPQPSATGPHATLSCVHVFGVHVKPMQRFCPLQNWAVPHGPQFRTPPQPSLTEPHCAPSCVHVFGLHVAWPQTFGAPPPPQVWPGAQSPQWMLPPHPFG
jgi:hypothetical protein